MRRTIILALGSVLTGTLLAWLAVMHRVVASSENERAAITALNQRITNAIERGDLDAVVACYTDDSDITFFEDTTPFEFQGQQNIRRYIGDLLASGSEIHDKLESGSILVSGDLAAAHYILTVTWRDKAGTHSEHGRYTQVLKKVNGEWRIWHEHFSVPYDPQTGKAVLN